MDGKGVPAADALLLQDPFFWWSGVNWCLNTRPEPSWHDGMKVNGEGWGVLWPHSWMLKSRLIISLQTNEIWPSPLSSSPLSFGQNNFKLSCEILHRLIKEVGKSNDPNTKQKKPKTKLCREWLVQYFCSHYSFSISVPVFAVWACFGHGALSSGRVLLLWTALYTAMEQPLPVPRAWVVLINL